MGLAANFNGAGALDSIGVRVGFEAEFEIPCAEEDVDLVLVAAFAFVPRSNPERADGLAAVTTSDNANIVTARIAKLIYRVPQVVTRLYEPSRAEVYRRLGLQTISSTTWGVGRIMQLLTHSRLDAVYEMGSGEVALLEFEVGVTLDGRTVQQIDASTEIQVVSITRSGQAFIPAGSMPFMKGDLVHVAVARSAQARFEVLLESR